MPGRGCTRNSDRATRRRRSHISWRVRRQTGHCNRGPPMSDPRADAKAIFLAALDREDAAARARFLDEACGADAPLRRRVEELLLAHREAGRFLGGPESPQATCDEAPPAESPGTVIGPYKLVEPIGE